MSPTRAGRLKLTIFSSFLQRMNGTMETPITTGISPHSYTQEFLLRVINAWKVELSSSLAGEAFSPSAKNCSSCHCPSERELYSIYPELIPA